MFTSQALAQNRSSSPSPARWFTRRDCATDTVAAADRFPWRHRPTGAAGGGLDRWTRQSVSPFERSGRTAVTTTGHQIYRTDDDRGRDGGNDDKDDDDYWMCDDEAFDEDGECLSLEDVRNSSWLRDFLPRIAELSPEEINDPAAATLCPACKGGPGRSVWYGGFQALLAHARTVRAKRMRLHRRFAEILEAELRNRSTRAGEGGDVPAQAATDEKWLGLGGAEGAAGDRMVLWPPMVVVLNTRLAKQEGSDKWLGMGNKELLDCFKDYEPVKARNAYGFNGHCGVSLLIFDGSILGYHQAERLHNHFTQGGRGKYQWHMQKPWRQTGGTRLLYGYMVTEEEELAAFGSYSGDRNKLKYEMKPYQTVVGNPLKEMCGSIQRQESLERDIAREIEQKRAMDGRLRQRDLEIEALRRKLTEQCDEHNNEIDSYEELIQRQSSKLKERELALQNVQKQLRSLHSSGVDDPGEAGSSMNLVEGEHDNPEYGMDEIAEEQRYLGAWDSEGKKKKKPLLHNALDIVGAPKLE